MKRLYAPLLLSLFGLLFFSSWRLTPFAPFMIYAASSPHFLWISLGCGLTVDLLSPGGRFGLWALSYLLTSLLLRRFRLDAPLYAATLALIFRLLTAGPLFSFGWIATDLITMPLLDGVFALLFVSLPMWVLYGRPEPERPVTLARPK
jgi:hypothetical protein